MVVGDNGDRRLSLEPLIHSLKLTLKPPAAVCFQGAGSLGRVSSTGGHHGASVAVGKYLGSPFSLFQLEEGHFTILTMGTSSG